MRGQAETTQAGSAQAAQEFLTQGVEASRQGDVEGACRLFQQAIEAAPAWPLPLFMLGSERASVSDFERAEALFAGAVLLDPAFHLARYQLGLLQFSGGRPQVALLTWGPLAQLPGEEPFPHLLQGFIALQADAFPEAMQHFETALPLAAANAGMQSDIRQIMRGIAEKLGMTPQPAQGEPDAAADSTAEHVLLSNYGRTTLH